MGKIFIYGVPGAGKTYFSKVLSKQLNFPVVAGDTIKSQVRKNTSKTDFPFLYLGTCQAYRQFGELNQDNAIQGLLAVRRALQIPVEQEIEKYDNLVLEAAFLDPRRMEKYGKVILLVSKDESQHKKQFLSHREKFFDLRGHEFKTARIIQEYLITEAAELEIEVVENNPELKNVIFRP